MADENNNSDDLVKVELIGKFTVKEVDHKELFFAEPSLNEMVMAEKNGGGLLEQTRYLLSRMARPKMPPEEFGRLSGPNFFKINKETQSLMGDFTLGNGQEEN